MNYQASKDKLMTDLKAYRRLIPAATPLEKSVLLMAMRGIMEQLEHINREERKLAKIAPSQAA